MRWWATVAAAALLLVLGLTGTVAAAPAPQRPFSVWLPYWNLAPAAASTLAHAAQISTASPWWYSVNASGVVTAEAGAGDARLVSALRDRGVSVVPTVGESAGLAAFDAMLASPRRRAVVVRALVGIARQPGYAGVDLDFEQFAVDPEDDIAGADAAAAGYPVLVAQLCRALHAIDRTCIVTVMPRTSDARALWRGRLATWVYDYTALAAAADRIRIMAYDEHAPEGSPGPVAPYAWVRQVIAYARAHMHAAKAELGLAAYGYTWGPGAGTTFTAAQAAQLAAAHDVRPVWSAAAEEAEFSYGRGRHRTIAWFEDARADLMRARLALAAGFAGVALWAAGDETPSLWSGAAALH